MNTKRAPKVRFKGFTDAWELRKLNEVAEFNPKSALPDTFEYVDLESVVGTDLISHRTESKATAPSRAQRLAQRGDVFYQTVRPYQKNNYLFDLPCNDYVFSTGYAQMRPNIDSRFLFSRIQEERFVKAVLDRCTGTSYPAINANDLYEIEIVVPTNKDEQVKIGSLFRNFDHLITLHQRKLDKMKELKKAFLNLIFSQKLRFYGFTDSWELRKFESIAARASSISADPTLPRVEYEDIISGIGLLNKDVKLKGISKPGIVFNQGDILYGKLRPYLHNWFLPSFSGLAVGDFWVLQPKDADSSFLFRLIQGQQFDDVANQSIGTKMPRADWNLVSKTLFFVPTSIDEQALIGRYFRSIDNLITLHQEKINQLTKLKTTFLKNMFI